jgi:hypothetical protein
MRSRGAGHRRRQRMTRWTFARALAGGLFVLGTGLARASDPASFEWSAPLSCPSREAMLLASWDLAPNDPPRPKETRSPPRSDWSPPPRAPSTWATARTLSPCSTNTSVAFPPASSRPRARRSASMRSVPSGVRATPAPRPCACGPSTLPRPFVASPRRAWTAQSEVHACGETAPCSSWTLLRSNFTSRGTSSTTSRHWRTSERHRARSPPR